MFEGRKQAVNSPNKNLKQSIGTIGLLKTIKQFRIHQNWWFFPIPDYTVHNGQSCIGRSI